MIRIHGIRERLSGYRRRHGRTWVWFTLIGAFTTAAQIGLQRVEVAHGYNIYWWSFFQGSILANLGMALNKKWTFKERSLPWLWAIVCWNTQKVPHSAASMLVFALLLQLPFLPYWGATLLTAGSLGIFSFVATTMFIDRTSLFDKWTATLLAACLLVWCRTHYKPKTAAWGRRGFPATGLTRAHFIIISLLGVNLKTHRGWRGRRAPRRAESLTRARWEVPRATGPEGF